MSAAKDMSVREIFDKFQIQGSLLDAMPYGSGHINDTFAATVSHAGTRVRYIFQRINQRVFRNPPAVMENIRRVTETAETRLKASGIKDFSRRSLSVIAARDGLPYVVDSARSYWRGYPFIEGARTYDVIEKPEQAYAAARAFGDFQNRVANLPGERLHETIPGFHHTRARYERLMASARNDPFGRLAGMGPELEFMQSREPLVDVLLNFLSRGEMPERITHNDTKLNNVMIDDATGEGICVIDLDTVMPGLALYDLGDMVRTATSPAAEDETDLSKVCMQMPMFEALARGYLSSAGNFLNEAECEYMPLSGKLIALEIGIRFLTDYLEGDTYFKIQRPAHNLDRARTQIALVRSIEQQEPAMKQLVADLRSQLPR